ncbi:DUF4307 domain-containing protein [Microbacterium sp. CJ88]|uniref:DUF4307 domain-containing protein n=1 Tax=Microbacterium sp. CJ88 TaxID=3445672 RepID=UPI003F65ED9E
MTTQQMLDERYGRVRTPRQRWVAGILIALAAVVVGAVAWTTIAATLDDVAADGTAFEVVDDHSVTLTFQLSAPAGSAVACAIEAQDEEHGVVGFRVVRIEASDQHTRAFRETIPTVARATTGLVNSCWVT